MAWTTAGENGAQHGINNLESTGRKIDSDDRHSVERLSVATTAVNLYSHGSEELVNYMANPTFSLALLSPIQKKQHVSGIHSGLLSMQPINIIDHWWR